MIMMYYSAQMKASIAFVILHLMVSDCSSIPLHTNRRALKNSSTSTVRLSSRPPISNEDVSAMVISRGSESEAKPKSYGNQTENNVNALKNTKTSATMNINKSILKEDSHNSIKTLRSKRSTHIDISNIIQEYVNYLLNYSASRMHPVAKASFISKL
jgi:hypothetical protein